MNDPPAKPKVSIITVNLNHVPGLLKTLDSVQEQSFRDFEHILVDGGSTDGSLEIIAERAGMFAYTVSEPDGGIYAAMNKGLRVARGEYIYFLNSGDCLAGSDVLYRFFSRNDYSEDLLYGDSLRPDNAGGWKEIGQPAQVTVARFFRMGLCHQTIFYRKELFDRLGGYDESLQIAGDWEFNLRVLMARRTTRHLPFPVVRYEGGGVSATRADITAREKEIILKRHLPEAVYQDYQRLLALEKECVRLKEYEVWTEQIRQRNPLLNCAMMTKWACQSVTEWFLRRGRGVNT